MTLTLPQPVAEYFEADKGNSDALSRCFTEQAVVQDEGHTYVGRPAIRRWKDAVAAKYQYTNELLACELSDSKTVVTSRVAGNFPGSPVDLRFSFRLEGERIASLEIGPVGTPAAT